MGVVGACYICHSLAPAIKLVCGISVGMGPAVPRHPYLSRRAARVQLQNIGSKMARKWILEKAPSMLRTQVSKSQVT